MSLWTLLLLIITFHLTPLYATCDHKAMPFRNTHTTRNFTNQRKGFIDISRTTESAPSPSPSPSPMSQCYSFDYPCECAYVISHTVPYNTSTQQTIFNAEIISTIRMLPSKCRHDIITCFCALTFPQCIQTTENVETNHSNHSIIPLCTDQCNTIVTSSCSQYIPQSTIDLFLPNTTTTNECFNVTPLPVGSSIPVMTCLPIGVNCCTGIYTLSPFTQECDVCYNPITSDQEHTLEITYLILTWTSVTLSILGVTPFMLDPFARTFPNYLPLCVVISSDIVAILLTSGSYTNSFEYGSYTCDSLSTTCLTQVFILCYFSLNVILYALWMGFRISHSCLSIDFQDRFSSLSLTNKPSHIFIVHVTTNAISFTIALICVFFARDKGAYMMPGGYCAPASYDPGQFYSFYVPWIVGLSLLLLFLVFDFIQFFRIKGHFLLLQIRATLFLCVVFVFALTLAVFFFVYKDYDPNDLIEYMSCSNSHPHLNDPPCKHTPDFFHYPSYFFVMVVIALSPAFEIIFLSLSRKEIWMWWVDVAMCRPFIPISVRINPAITPGSSVGKTEARRDVKRESDDRRHDYYWE